MNAKLTIDSNVGKTTLCFDFDRMEADGKGIQFFDIEDPAEQKDNDGSPPTIDKILDDNWLRKKFFYQTDLFGNKFAYVLFKDIWNMVVV